MKFVSAVLATLATTSHAAGLRRDLEREHKRLPPGFSPVPLPTPPAPSPTEAPAPVCDAVLEAGNGNQETTEYVAVRYDPSAENCLDLTDTDVRSKVARAYYTAYVNLDAGCAQNGAVCELESAEMLAREESSGTVLLKLATHCNSWRYFRDDREMCGIQVYNETNTKDREVSFRRMGEDGPAPGNNDCNCPRPTQAAIVAVMNEVLRRMIPCSVDGSADHSGAPTPAPTDLAWVVATEQLCLTECHNGPSTDDDDDDESTSEEQAKEYIYGSAGVSATCDTTRTPTRSPTKSPTRTPTKSPTTQKPTKSPTGSPTAEPTAPPTTAVPVTPPPSAVPVTPPPSAVPVTPPPSAVPVTPPPSAVPVTSPPSAVPVTSPPTETTTSDSTTGTTVETSGVTTPPTPAPTPAATDPVTSSPTSSPTPAPTPEPTDPITSSPTVGFGIRFLRGVEEASV